MLPNRPKQVSPVVDNSPDAPRRYQRYACSAVGQ